jgi:DNA-binding domain/Domain of unknown function (DUF4469) with IG-like fold
MAISYALVENALTPDPDDYLAQVQFGESADTETVIARIKERGSTLTEADLRAALTELYAVCESLVLEGRRVNLLGLVELYPKVAGTFHGADAAFDPAQHRADVGASVGNRLREGVRAKATVARVATQRPQPVLLSYSDLASGSVNATVTPATIGSVIGSRLKFEASKHDEGIFLVPVGSSGAAVKVTQVQENKPKRLTFLVPPLPPGSYTLEVRTRFTVTGEVRTGSLESTLTH